MVCITPTICAYDNPPGQLDVILPFSPSFICDCVRGLVWTYSEPRGEERKAEDAVLVDDFGPLADGCNEGL